MVQSQTIFYGRGVPRDKELLSIITFGTCVDVDHRGIIHSSASTAEQSHDSDGDNPG